MDEKWVEANGGGGAVTPFKHLRNACSIHSRITCPVGGGVALPSVYAFTLGHIVKRN